MITGTHHNDDLPLLDIEIALRNFKILWADGCQIESNGDIFSRPFFEYSKIRLFVALTSHKEILTSPIINRSMLIAIFACETYQDHSLLRFIVYEFSKKYSFDLISHLKDIYYLPFLKRICQLCPTAGDIIVAKILFDTNFRQMLNHREFVELLSIMDLTDYPLQLGLALSPDAEQNTFDWPRILLELAVKLADFGKVDMLLNILRNDIALQHIRVRDPLNTQRFYYLIKAVFKCAEYDIHLAIRLLAHPDIPLDVIQKPIQDSRNNDCIHHVGVELFFLVAHYWVKSTDHHFKRALKANIKKRTTEAIDIDEQIKILDYNPDEIAFLSKNIHNFPHEFTKDNPQLGDTFRRNVNVRLLVITFGENNPSLVNIIKSDDQLNHVVVSAVKDRRVNFVFNLLNQRPISLAMLNPLGSALEKTTMVVDKLVYLAMLMGEVFYDSCSQSFLRPEEHHKERHKERQIETKLSRVKARLEGDRRSFVAAAMACANVPSDIQGKILTFAYPYLTPRHLKAGPAIVSRWKDPDKRAELRLQILENKINKQLKII